MRYLKTFETNYIPFGKFKVGDIVNFPYKDDNIICIISDYNHLYDGFSRRNEPLKNCVAIQPIELKTIKNGEILLFAHSSEDYIKFISSVRTIKSLEPLTKEEEEKFKLIFNSMKYNI